MSYEDCVRCGYGNDVRDAQHGQQRALAPEVASTDVVVEHVGEAVFAKAVTVLAHGGRLVTCGGTTGPRVSLLLPHLFIKNLSVLGSTMGPRKALPEIMRRLAEGRWRTAVDRVLPLSRVREAHAALEAREVAGKVVLVPGE